MTGSLYLRLKSLNTRTVRGVTSPKNIVRVAALHNLREIQAELGASANSGINPARMHLNYQLRGPATADEVASLAVALLDNAGVKTLRRDACMALELVVSLQADTAIDHREYFAAAVTWADAYFNVPILSAAVHLDEAAPHLHVLLLPLVGGRMQGGALAGGPAKIRAMLADFQHQVAQRFGLTHQPRTKRLSKPVRDAAGRVVLDALRARPERLIEPGMRDALIAALGSQAETLLPLLGLSMPTTKKAGKTFVQIMTAPCKPERARRPAPNAKHIDVAQTLGNAVNQEFDNVYVSVDVAPALDISLPTTDHPTVIDQSANASTTGNQLSAAPGQQASSSTAAPQSTTGLQREHSTTGADVPPPGWQGSDEMASHCKAEDALSFEDIPPAGAPGIAGASVAGAGQRQPSTGVQNILHTPLVVSANPGTDQACQHQHCDANHATATAPTKRQAQTVKTAPTALASTTPKRQRTAAKVASTRSTAHHQAASIEQTTASPASQVTTAKTRKRTSKVAASTSPSPRTSAAGIAPAADQADTQPAKPGPHQAAHQQDQQHRAHAIEEQAAPAGRPQTGNAGIEVTVDTPATRSAAKGIVPADDTRAAQSAVNATVPACQHLASNDDVTPGNAKASHAARAKRTKALTATPTSAPAAPRAGKRKPASSRVVTTARPQETPVRLNSDERGIDTAKLAAELRENVRSTTCRPARKRAPPDNAAPVPATPAKRMDTSSKPARQKRQCDASGDQLDEIRRLADVEQADARCAWSTSSAAPTGVKPGKSRNYTSTNQPDEIRTLGLAGCSSMSSASHSAEISAQCSWPRFLGQCSPEYSGQLQDDQQASQRAGEDDHHDAATLGQLPVPAPGIEDSATARQAAPAGIAAHVCHQSPAPVIEQAHPQGGASTVAQLRPLEGEQVRHHVDGYQRQRDDEHAAELWDSERGEFVTMPSRQAKRTSSSSHADEPYADDLAAVWFDARPAVIEAALDSIRAVHSRQ